MSSLWSGERLPTGQAFSISLGELCVDKVRFSGCTCRLESTGNTLDTKLGLPIPALSSTPFVALLEGAPVLLSCAHPLEGHSRSGPREGRQLWPWPPGQIWASGPQRASPPPLSHRALSEERPEGLLCHRGLRQMWSSLLLMLSCSSSSPSSTAAARASWKYSVASWAS